MWLSAILGMSTIFAEAVLAQKYRVVSHGKYIGGPAFYITHGLTPKIGRGAARFLSGFFSIALDYRAGFHRQRDPIQLHRLGHEFGF